MSKRPHIVVLAAMALSGLVAGTAPASAADSDIRINADSDIRINADSDIRINEVQSNSAAGAPDFVELTNVGDSEVDVSGWVLRDNQDDNTHVIPNGTTIAPGDFLVIEPTEFGLGANDSARLYDETLTAIDQYPWTEHAFTEGRISDGTGEFVDTEPTPGKPNVARQQTQQPKPVDTGIRVNEVLSSDPALEDFVELTNIGDEPVDISNWILRDNDPLSELRIPEGTVVEPGDFFVIEPDTAPHGFGLGANDEINVITEDGSGLADRYAWTEHAMSEGRIPDGTGEFVDTEITRGQANVSRATKSPVVINEVESNGDPVSDWVELANTDTTNPVDVSGWTIRDSDPDNPAIVLPEGTEIESGGYLGVRTDAPEDFFGLGGNDRVTVRDETDAVIDSFGWVDGHSTTTFGRCPDMTGEFADTARSTFEAANDCAEVTEPQGKKWPFSPEVVDAIAPGTFGDDTSGLDLAADGTLYAVNNGLGEIYAMRQSDGIYSVDKTWTAAYPDGSGPPDTEGVSVVGDGSLLLATERSDAASNDSRPSILRVDLGPEGKTPATHEWNLADITGPIGANGGPEAVEWISDADAVRLGVKDAAGKVYNPADYGPHLGGIVAVAVESTGVIYLLVLQTDGQVTLLQTISPSSGSDNAASTDDPVPFVMSLDWRAGGNELWGLCDEVCGNRSTQYAFENGVLTPKGDYNPPDGMDPSYTNEGLAIQWCAVDPAAIPTVLWASDSPHEDVSLRSATGGPCTAKPGGPPGTSDPRDVDATDGSTQNLPNAGAVVGPGLVVLAALFIALGIALTRHASRRSPR